MARKPRKYGETGIYHIILRGNNQGNIFYDDKDRLFFLSRLRKYTEELKIPLYSYCLMGNHVHLLIGNGNYSMPLLIKKITCSYVYYFNHKYERSGHLFQGRYKSEAIEEINYFKTVFRYILHNPEKANICCFSQYKWSSYRELFNPQSIVARESIKEIFESSDSLFSFLSQREYESCMENITNPQINKDELYAKFINQLLNIRSPMEIMKFDLYRKKDSIHLLKETGLSISMISRLTSISRKIIQLS